MQPSRSMSWQKIDDSKDYTIGHMSLTDPDEPINLPKSILSSLIKTSKLLIKIRSNSLNKSTHDLRNDPSRNPSIKPKESLLLSVKEQEAEEDVVPDKPLESSEENQQSLSGELNADKTIALYQSMPKGYSHFLNYGPPKHLQEKVEYNKLQLNHNRIAVELKQWREQADVRWAALADNDINFREDIKNLESTLEKNKGKFERALTGYEVNMRQKEEYQRQLENLMGDLKVLQQQHKNILKTVPKCEMFTKFSANLVKVSSGKFKSLQDVIERHTTLINSFNFQLNRFFRGREVLDEVQDLCGELSKQHVNNLTQLKNQLESDKLYLRQLKVDNEALVTGLQNCEQAHGKQMGADAAVENSLNHIFQHFMIFRSFTRKHMVKCETDLERIEALGHIILDYNMIIDEINAEARRDEMKRRRRKSSFLPNVASANTAAR